jgi:predicted nucleotidyltransferase
MEKWEATAREFIEQCDFYDEIEIVFLAGSHAVGNADKYSDIDLYIVLNDRCDWRERGNKLFDNGFRVEYFANPVRQIKKYIDSSYSDVRMPEINMILNGIVIKDKNSTAESLLEYCLQKRIDNFPVLGEFHVQTGLYLIWDNFDELTRAYENEAADFTMQYYIFIENAFYFYSRYISSPVPNYHHLYKWLTDETYNNNFKLPSYRDKIFLELIIKAFDSLNANIMFAQARNIKDYVLNKIGGFNIDNFALKGPLDC